MKIIITDSIAREGIEILQQYADVDVQPDLTPEQLQSIIGRYDALIVRSQTKVTSRIIDAADNLAVMNPSLLFGV